MDPDIHRRQSERAEQRAEDARQRICAARTATERHEQLVKAGDARRGELHVRAAAFQRDAQELFERAAALQELHADHERRVSEILIAGGSSPHPPMPAYPADLMDRYRALTHQQALADRRDEVADEREAAADERERLADAREHAGHQRDRLADAGEGAGQRRRDRDTAQVARDQAAIDREGASSQRRRAARHE